MASKNKVNDWMKMEPNIKKKLSNIEKNNRLKTIESLMTVYKSNFVELRNEHRIQILRYFTNYPGLFQGKKDMIYFITKVFFELIYITT